MNLLDTNALKTFLDAKTDILWHYDQINENLDEIVVTLLQSWQGKGADAFKEDTAKVRANITGLYDILKTMCDTLQGCLEVYEECDARLGTNNSK